MGNRHNKKACELNVPFLPSLPVAVTVRCSGKTHEIVWDGKNLRLSNHPNKAAERILVEFGSSCRCFKVKHAWVKGEVNKLPPGLVTACEIYRRTVRAHRWAVLHGPRYGQRGEPQEHHILPRGMATLQMEGKAKQSWLVQAAWEQTSYGPGKRADYLRIIVGNPTLTREVWAPKDQLYETTCSTQVRIPYGWGRRVHDRGLAVVDGMFVLDALTPKDADDYAAWLCARRLSGMSVEGERPWWRRPDGRLLVDFSRGTPVLAVKPGKGFVCYPWRAYVHKTASGDATIEWE